MDETVSNDFSLKRKKPVIKVNTKKLKDGTKVTTVKSKPKRKKKKLFSKVIKTGLKYSPMGLAVRGGVKAGQLIAKKRKKSVGQASVAFLNPLIPAMKKGLEQKGLSTKSLSNNQVIEKFYNLYISKLADKTSPYEPLKENEFSNHYLFNQDYSTFDSDNIVGVSDAQTLINVGKGIVSGFKKWRAKKKAAKKGNKNPIEVMPKEEVVLANEADKVVNTLQTEAKKQEPVKKGNMNTYLIGGAVLVVAVMLFLKFRK